MRKYRITARLIVFSAFAVSLSSAVHAASYAITDLGTLGGTESSGLALNASGQVTGASHITEAKNINSFLWKPATPNSGSGAMTDLGTLGGTQSFGNGLNTSGQVTGESFTTSDA